MACIDFSNDSRIRKKYVPLTNQQRYLRHVKRVAARNLCIPSETLKQLLAQQYNLECDSEEFKEKISDLLGEEDELSCEEYQLMSKCDLAFYFTIHHPPLLNCVECKKNSSNATCNCDKIIYRSETITNTNPSWKPFEGSTLCSPSISQIIIRVYYVFMGNRKKNPLCFESNGIMQNNDHRHNAMDTQLKVVNSDGLESGVLFLEWNVFLNGLLFVGEEFPKDRRLTTNAIVFGLTEGFYTSFCSVASEEMMNNILLPRESLQIEDLSMIRNSYCMNTLIRIQMIQYIIQATSARVHLVKEILERKIAETKSKQDLLYKIEKTNASINLLASILNSRRKKFHDGKERVQEIVNQIDERNTEMSANMQLFKENINLLYQFRNCKLVEAASRLLQTRDALISRRRLLTRELFEEIYTIHSFPDSRGYSIQGIFLPDTERFEEHDPKMISIALGYVTHLVALLSHILDINLHYRLIFNGSRSSIIDSYSHFLRSNEKDIPLHYKSGRNVVFLKHGLFLLNRIVIYIRRCVGLSTATSTFTLANLYSLFTECLLLDDYNINKDQTLYKFSPKYANIPETYNQNILRDISLIKDKDCMINWLWKEVEQLTIHILTHKPDSPLKGRSQFRFFSFSSQQSDPPPTVEDTSISSSATASSEEEIKQTISKQRQNRQKMSNQCLNRISSSISPSIAYPNLTPSWLSPDSTASTSSLADSIVRNRRASSSLCFDNLETTYPPLSSSPTRLHPNRFQYMKRIRSISGYGISHHSLPQSRESFLHSRATSHSSSSAINSSPLISVSLDKGLNNLQVHDVPESETSADSSASNGSESLLKMLNANYDLNEEKVAESVMHLTTANTTTNDHWPQFPEH